MQILVFVLLVAVVWVGGCAVTRYNEGQRKEIYREVWKNAPELERQHGGLSAEIVRLHQFRETLEKRKRLFESEEAKYEADRKITEVDRQIQRLESQRLDIISSVERQALTNVSTKVENPMQRETISRMEAETREIVSDAESLRLEIESGVAGEGYSPGAVEAPKSGREKVGMELRSFKDTESPVEPSRSRSSPSPKHLFEPRLWNDRYGRQVSARLLHVSDARGNPVATLGTDPADLAASDWVLHLQRQDGAIIRVPAVKFSSRDLDFISQGR